MQRDELPGQVGQQCCGGVGAGDHHGLVLQGRDDLGGPGGVPPAPVGFELGVSPCLARSLQLDWDGPGGDGPLAGGGASGLLHRGTEDRAQPGPRSGILPATRSAEGVNNPTRLPDRTRITPTFRRYSNAKSDLEHHVHADNSALSRTFLA